MKIGAGSHPFPPLTTHIPKVNSMCKQLKFKHFGTSIQEGHKSDSEHAGQRAVC